MLQTCDLTPAELQQWQGFSHFVFLNYNTLSYKNDMKYNTSIFFHIWNQYLVKTYDTRLWDESRTDAGWTMTSSVHCELRQSRNICSTKFEGEITVYLKNSEFLLIWSRELYVVPPLNCHAWALSHMNSLKCINREGKEYKRILTLDKNALRS